MGSLNPRTGEIAAVIVAAGRSRRMGTSKLFLPWGNSTVIERIVSRLRSANIPRIFVVSGGDHEQLENLLASDKVRVINNPDAANGEMLDSIKVGIRVIPQSVDGVMIVLGDQPQMESEVVKMIAGLFKETGAQIVVPSFQMRRGHPWIIGRSHWEEILALGPDESLRSFLKKHSHEIQYVPVETSSILMDLDTPEDYQAYAPKNE